MKMRQVAQGVSAVIGLGGVLLVGCQAQERLPATQPTVVIEPTRQSVYNIEKLQVAPQAVQDQFLLQFPDTSVNSVTLAPTSSGPIIYHITYVRNGVAGRVSYFANGNVFRGPASGNAGAGQIAQPAPGTVTPGAGTAPPPTINPPIIAPATVPTIRGGTTLPPDTTRPQR